ncbi:MAG: hypothetical protein LW650_04685 [Planctomycetaceae bacterium]|jgi:hypothetical protein|nr:hypothetical protein [Phycisphaerales bacterium]MCE2652803.1 hypothetical protein [Planctomycetaceae bacterium]
MDGEARGDRAQMGGGAQAGARGGVGAWAVWLWRSKWGLLRLTLAGALVWVVVADSGARVARRALASLPGYDFAAEVRALRGEGRLGEAHTLAQAWAASAGERGAAQEAAEAVAAASAIRAEQESVWRKVTDVGRGALTGRGETLAELLGAIGADLFVVGDVRDLLIQGTHLAMDGEADPVIVALSGVGLATTVVPMVDWGPAVLKVARKAGAMGADLGADMVRLARSDVDGIRRVARQAGVLAAQASPGGALRLLRHARSADDVAMLAAFAEKHSAGAKGFVALHVTGEAGVDTLRAARQAEVAAQTGASAGASAAAKAGARGAASVADAERVVLAAAEKGPAGAALLKRGALAKMMRPHPLIGLAKGVYKGTVPAAITRALDWLGDAWWWALPAAVLWAAAEVGLLAARRPRGRGLRSGEQKGRSQ